VYLYYEVSAFICIEFVCLFPKAVQCGAKQANKRLATILTISTGIQNKEIRAFATFFFIVFLFVLFQAPTSKTLVWKNPHLFRFIQHKPVKTG